MVQGCRLFRDASVVLTRLQWWGGASGLASIRDCAVRSSASTPSGRRCRLGMLRSEQR